MSSGRYEDLTGRRFGKWTVEARNPAPDDLTSRAVQWLVVCDCGNEGSVRSRDLNAGLSTQCRPCAFSAFLEEGKKHYFRSKSAGKR